MVLLATEGESDMATITANHGDTFSLWFEELRPWKKADIGRRRLASIRCSGVPLHVWTDEFFELLLKQRVDYGFLLPFCAGLIHERAFEVLHPFQTRFLVWPSVEDLVVIGLVSGCSLGSLGFCVFVVFSGLKCG
ncbi:hypothetical protein Ancab_037678 [Ancistrocladus abbreviatus]